MNVTKLEMFAHVVYKQILRQLLLYAVLVWDVYAKTHKNQNSSFSI